MPWQISGTFTRVNNDFQGASVWSQDQQAGIKIIATRHDFHDEDLALGIADCLNLDGYNNMRANINMADTYKVVSLADGTSSGDAVNKGQLDAVDAQVTTNTSNISANASNIAQNAADITKNTQDIAAIDAISEAPIDGNFYSRKDAAWAIPPGGVSGDDIITNITWDNQTLAHTRTAGNWDISLRMFTEFVSNGQIKHKLATNSAGGNVTILPAQGNRHRVVNTGAMTITFDLTGIGSDTDIGNTYHQEGQIVIRNGTGAGAISIGGVTPKTIGTPTDTDDVNQILTYIIQRISGSNEVTLVWSN